MEMNFPNKIIMLAFSNIRKYKGQTVNLLLFVFLAAMLLQTGLLLFFDLSRSFDERAGELHAPHLTFLQSKDATCDEQLSWLQEHPQIVEIEKQEVLAGNGEIYMNGMKTPETLIFAKADGKQSMNPPSLIGASQPLDTGSIYVPYAMKAAAGYEIGDAFFIDMMDEEITFAIAGFTEDIMFGNMMNTTYRIYVTDEDYAGLEERLPELHYNLLSCRLTDPDISTDLQVSYRKEFFHSGGQTNGIPALLTTISYTIAKSTNTYMPDIVAMVITAFAMILLTVSLIVMRFGIINNIEESIVNIGTLKAVGYRNRQIIAYMLLQFGGVAVIGAVFGIAASGGILPVLANVIQSQSAILWQPGFDAFFAAVSLCFTVSSVLLVACLTAGRVYRLHPLTALRGGLETHNFKKNSLPLDRSYGSLSFLFAMKRLAKNKGQAVMIIVIIVMLSFVTVMGISIYYNIGMNTYGFVSMMAGEYPDAVFTLKDPDDTTQVLKNLQGRPEVSNAFEYDGYSGIFLTGEDVEVIAYTARDYSTLQGSLIVEGRYPKHRNEIAAGGNFLTSIGKKTGDTVTLKRGDRSEDFLITGIMQGFANGGLLVLTTYDGILSLHPDFQFKDIYVYMEPGADTKDLIDSIQADEEGKIANVNNTSESLEAQFGSIGPVFAAVTAGLLTVSLTIVCLVLFLVIKTVIIRRRREFGIQKAIGFTTFQIMNQIALTYTPIVTIAVIIGGIGGIFGFNPLLSFFMRSQGIVRTNFQAPIGWTVITCIVLAIVAYGMSMLIAWRIRKITAYALVSE